MTAPTNQSSQWKNYLKGSGSNEVFVPRLGLFYGKHDTVGGQSNDEGALLATGSSLWNYAATFEAGTDCIGLVQRAASYSLTGNPYKWVKLPLGIMESEKTKYSSVLALFDNTHYRRYPLSSPEGDTIVQNMVGYDASTYLKKDNRSPDEETLALALLRTIVPGDIWVKQGLSVSSWSSHIAIVAQVPEYKDGMTAEKYMEGLILIEGEFNDKMQSVIKKLSVADYNLSNLTSPRTIYPGIAFPQNGLSLNCQSWAIRRLK